MEKVASYTLVSKEELSRLYTEISFLQAGKTFSCGCKFSYVVSMWTWDFCELHGKVHLMAKEIEQLKSLNKEYRQALTESGWQPIKP